jgi:DNA-binding beta-propeller fold protein YncE
MRLGVVLLAVLPTVVAAAMLGTPAIRAQPAPLTLEAKIPLGPVRGRIDHLAVDADRQLLFVAELGNDSVGIVDLKAGMVVRRLERLSEPQGVGWHAPTGTLYVANAGDGSVRLFQAPDFRAIGQIALGDDADNIRLDARRDRVVVGYGKGALAVIDPASRREIGEMPLKGHPESFRFDEPGSRIFVNVPDARQIAVVDVDAQRQTGSLDLAGARSNFPMAIDGDAHRLIVIARSPARLLVFSTGDGKPMASIETCGDADDVFVDSARRRVYVVCGEGAVDVFDRTDAGYSRAARIPTAAGARTGLFVPATGRLYVAVRAGSGAVAALWVYRAGP